MIKTLIAYTDEIDDIEYALEQLKTQIDFDRDLLSNSVGLISCLPEYIESGLLKALCDALPFDIAGTTTIGTTAPGIEDLTPLTLTVLTGDDVYFRSSWTEPVTRPDVSIIKDSFDAANAGITERAKLLIVFGPLLSTVGGDFFNDAINEASGGVPCFGALSVDDTPDYHSSQIIYNGETSVDRLSYIFVYGNVNPRFHLATLSQEKISKDKGVVTKSDGISLTAVNDKPVSDFLISQGLKLNADGIFEGVNSFPYIVDFDDGAPPIVRVMLSFTPEGSVICGGTIPEGATLSVGFFDRDEILNSTRNAVTQIETGADTHGLLIFSCIARYLNLDYSPDEESRSIRSHLEPTGIPFQFTYGGGEFCPIPTTDDPNELVNRYHNCTLVVCVL
jgi:hypothetical protein